MKPFTQHVVRGDYWVPTNCSLIVNGGVASLIAWLDHSCQKTEVGGKQGHAPCRRILLQQIPMTRINIQVAPGPQQLLNGQGVQRISGFKSECHGIRFGTLNVGSLCGRKTEVCEELRKRRVDVCCIQEVRWKGQGARFVGILGQRYKLWWSENDAGFGGVGILVKEEISGNVVEVRRKSDRVMAIVLTLGREVMRVICAYGPQSGRPDAVRFYDEMGSSSEIIVSLGDFNRHVGKYAEGFEGVHGGNGVGKRNAEGRRLLEFCDERELSVANTWFKKTDRRKIPYSAGGCGTEIDFVLVGEKYRKYIRDIKVIPWKLQHRMVVVDLDKKVLKKVVRKERIIRRKIWKLNENQTRVRFEKRVKELVSTDVPDLWKTS